MRWGKSRKLRYSGGKIFWWSDDIFGVH